MTTPQFVFHYTDTEIAFRFWSLDTRLQSRQQKRLPSSNVLKDASVNLKIPDGWIEMKTKNINLIFLIYGSSIITLVLIFFIQCRPSHAPILKLLPHPQCSTTVISRSIPGQKRTRCVPH